MVKNDISQGYNEMHCHLVGLYGQIEYIGDNRWDARLGVRGNAYWNDGKFYLKPEVRTRIRCHLSPTVDIQATFDYLSQFYHTLEGIPTGWSIDMKIPSTGAYAPEQSTQVYAGVSWDRGHFRCEIGGYYKYMQNLIYFAEASSMFTSSLASWQGKVDVGTGTSYGMELQMQYKGEKLHTNLSYTLSKTDRSFSMIHGGQPFPAKYDRRHILSFDGKYVLNKTNRIEHGVNTAVALSSGYMESLKSGTYTALLPGMSEDDPLYLALSQRDYYGGPNNYRMPYYFRWDCGYFIHIDSEKVHQKLNIGIYNLTNRHNAISLYYDDAEQTWKKISLFPIMPSLSYVIEF